MKYSKEIVERICKHLKRGATITSTCEVVGIHKDTFYEWMKSKSDFSDTIKKATAIPNQKVERALFLSTQKQRYKEKHFKVIEVTNKVTKETNIKIVPEKVITKVIQPNVTAQIFWLKNKNPEEWKDRQEHEFVNPLQIILSDKFLPKDNGRTKSE